MSGGKYQLRKSRAYPDTHRESESGRIDVSDILKANLEKQLENESYVPVEKPKRRRTRDYLLLMILANMALLAPMLVFPSNVMVLVSSLSGMVIFSTGITWVMWGVMNDY